MNRYNQLLQLIEERKPQTICEVGTWNGLRARMMAEEALKHQEKVFYFGYDLFEEATDQTDAEELNVKKHFSVSEVEQTLNEFKELHPGFDFILTKGNTRDTLKDSLVDIDFAFIDGGHSLETIQSDYEALKGAKFIVMDDYYSEGPDTKEFGCNELVEKMSHTVLPVRDRVAGGGYVQMVVLGDYTPPGGRKTLRVKTKNCVPDEDIQSNIRYSQEKIKNWFPECNSHRGVAVLVSGGPSLSEHLEDIRKRQKEGEKIICVKHSHDLLIEAGIVPWACMLLDPRDHVQDFVENPHKDVIYFVASMCHPTTVDQLMDNGADVWGYHAAVGAGEENVCKEGFLVAGGSTSAMRGISCLHAMGFRQFHMYGFDSCYWQDMDTTIKTKMGDQRYFKVDVNGREFWTDAELVAQAQDFEQVYASGVVPDLTVHGDGMIPHIFQTLRRMKANFNEVF